MLTSSPRNTTSTKNISRKSLYLCCGGFILWLSIRNFPTNVSFAKKTFFTEQEQTTTTTTVTTTTTANSIHKHWQELGATMVRVYDFVSVERGCILEKRPRIYTKVRVENRTKDIPTPRIKGIMYNKVPKTGSSTLAGINKRIAKRLGYRYYQYLFLHEKKQQQQHMSKQTTMAAAYTSTAASASNLPFSYTIPWYITNAATVAADTTATNPTAIQQCIRYDDHIVNAGKYYGQRDTTKSFLWASIRDPASRAMSRIFYYHISLGNAKATDEKILRLLNGTGSWTDYNPQYGIVTRGKGGFQLQYLDLMIMNQSSIPNWYAWNETQPTAVQNINTIQERVQDVVQSYDFIALAERMDESLVLLQLLLHLPIGDILSVNDAKVGGKSYVMKSMKEDYEICVPLQKTFRSPKVKEYLSSGEWYARNYGDYLLYSAVNQSIDLTISSLNKINYHDYYKGIGKYYYEYYDDVEKDQKEKRMTRTTTKSTASETKTPFLPLFDQALIDYRHFNKIANNMCQKEVFASCSAQTLLSSLETVAAAATATTSDKTNHSASDMLSFLLEQDDGKGIKVMYNEKQAGNCYSGDEGCGYACLDRICIENGWD